MTDKEVADISKLYAKLYAKRKGQTVRDRAGNIIEKYCVLCGAKVSDFSEKVCDYCRKYRGEY